MASLVTEILMNTGLLEKEDLATRIDKVSSQINGLKMEIGTALRQQYVDFIPSLDHMDQLHSRAKTLDSDMQDLANKLQGDIKVKLKTSTSDVQELTKELDKSNTSIAVLKTLCEVHRRLKELHTSLKCKNFTEAAETLDSMEGDLNVLFKCGYSEMKIVQALTCEERVLRETLFYQLGESWSKTIEFQSFSGGKGKSSKAASGTQLVIGQTETFLGTLQAMQTSQCLSNKLEGFSKKLMELILNPIIRSKGQPVVSTKKEKITIAVVKTKGEKSDEAPCPGNVYNDILQVLRALEAPLLGHVIKQVVHGGEVRCVSIMSMLGSLIWPAIAKSLIKDCLTPSIPANNKQLEEYKEIYAATKQFEESLQELGFIEAQAHPLTDYGKNVNIHFANKRCQELLVEARRLMQQDLQMTVEVGWTKADQSAETSVDEKNPLGPGIAAFPQCCVSQSVQKLIDLCYQTLHEASTSLEQCFQLFYTVRNMLELFCEVVPHYHKDSLEQLPRVAAVHHNNCMYISHHLLTLGHRYQHIFPSPLSDGASTFVDLVPVLRREAATHFLSQMRLQRDYLLESLRVAGGFLTVAEPENKTSSTQAIKQVLHRWNHLKAVWGEVLPVNVYTKTMATLVNTVLMHIVEQITRLEDISADDAYQLHLILSKLKEETPDVLQPATSQVPVTVEVVVKQWSSFTELLFILEASMQAIVDRWADGKGPLALVFPPATVKSLIRALFQNTDRRANALGKIKLS